MLESIPIPESIPEPIQEPIPEPIPELTPKPIPESILQPIPESVPESIPIPKQIPETDSGPTIRNRFQKSVKLAGIDFEKNFIFPITTLY